MKTKQHSVTVSFFLCLFLGYFGVHKFYEGKAKLGLLYLCTAGLCGIGWLVDSVSLLLKMLRGKDGGSSRPATNAGKRLSSSERQARLATFSACVTAIPHVEIPRSGAKINRRPPSDMPEIKFTNITRSTNLARLFPLVSVDVETTGLNTGGNDIIEVSAIKYDVGFEPVSCFSTLLKPRHPIPAEASAVNHITDEMVKDCPKFSEIAPAFSKYISGCSIVGHNLEFDLKFLFVCGADLPENVRYYDTLDLAKKTLTAKGGKIYDRAKGKYVESSTYDVENYKLDTLCEYYGICRSDAHRSLSDCFATGKIFERIIGDKTA